MRESQNSFLAPAALEPTAAPRFDRRQAASEKRGYAPTTRSVARIVCFFCLIAVCTFVLDSVINSGLRRIRTSAFGVQNRIVEGTIDADIVIAGSSRALTHYDPRVISAMTGRNAFNIGLNGAQTDMQVARFKTYLEHNRKPALLIFNLDIFSFQTTHGGVYDPGQYLPYLNEPTIYAALERIDKNVWKSKFLPLYGYAVVDLRFTWVQGVLGFLGWNPGEDHFFGFKPRYAEWTDDFERLRKTNPNGVEFAIEHDGNSLMEELLQLCKQRGIAALLVYSPEYVDMQALTRNRSRIFSSFSTLSERYGVPIWDFSSSVISLHKENFYNSQHLNAVGAAAFTKDLAERLITDPYIGNMLRPSQEKLP